MWALSRTTSSSSQQWTTRDAHKTPETHREPDRVIGRHSAIKPRAFCNYFFFFCFHAIIMRRKLPTFIQKAKRFYWWIPSGFDCCCRVLFASLRVVVDRRAHILGFVKIVNYFRVIFVSSQSTAHTDYWLFAQNLTFDILKSDWMSSRACKNVIEIGRQRRRRFSNVVNCDRVFSWLGFFGALSLKSGATCSHFGMHQSSSVTWYTSFFYRFCVLHNRSLAQRDFDICKLSGSVLD